MDQMIGTDVSLRCPACEVTLLLRVYSFETGLLPAQAQALTR